MGFLNTKELKKKRFSFRRKQKGDPPERRVGKGKEPAAVKKVTETPETVSEDDTTPSVASRDPPQDAAAKLPPGNEAEKSAELMSPRRNLLGELNVVEDDEDDGMELVLGPFTPLQPEGKVEDEEVDIPSDEEPAKTPSKEPTTTPLDPDELVRKPDADGGTKSSSARRMDDDVPDDENNFNGTPMAQKTVNVKMDSPKADPPIVTAEKAEPAPVVEDGDNNNDDHIKASDPIVEAGKADSPWNDAEATARKLLGVFNCVEDSTCLPENINERVIDTACNPMSKSDKRGLKRTLSYYNDQFAVKFLDEILNVGFALIHHVPSGEGDWSGRSATMILRPGTCNANTTVPPCLEWTTMAGGTQTDMETKSISLLHIHSITSSNLDDEDEKNGDDSDIDEEENEELQCLFTVTTNDGVVEVFEAITPDETAKLVAGIKNLSARFANQLIAGDIRAFTDFYSQHNDGADVKLTVSEAMVRLSHSFFDA